MADRVVSYVFRGSFGNLTAGLAAGGKAVGDFGGKLTALDKQGVRMRAGLTSIGQSAGRMGLVAAGGLAVMMGAAANFDQAMSNVQAATHETTGNMELLRAAAIKAGADTVFSAGEAANAIEELAKAGVSSADILGGGLAGALSLAAAGGLDVGRAAEIAATALTQFKLEGSDVNHVADLLAAGAGKAQGSVEDLGMALKQSGLVAAQTGLSIDETTGTLAAFASAGLIGSDAGTSFKTMLQALTPSGQKAREEMEKLGISAYDAQGNFIGMAEFAGNLRDGLSGLSTEQQNAALKIIFGSDAVRAASVLYQQGADGIQGWIDKTNDAGYAAETAATRMDNLKGDLEQLRGSLETALIGAGTGSQAPLRSLVQDLTKVVNLFNSAPPAVQGLATKLAGLTAITGGAAWFGSKVINGISDTREAMDKLTGSAARSAKVMSSLKAASAVGLTILGVATAMDTLHQSLDRSTPGVETMTKDLLNLSDAQGAQALAQSIGDLGAALGDIDGSGLGDTMNDLYRSIPVVGGTAQKFAQTIPVLGASMFDADQKSRDAAISLNAVDSAMANIVTSGSPEQAASAFKQLADMYGLTSDEQAKLLEHLPQYQNALDGASNSAQLSATSGNQAASAMSGLASASGAVTKAAGKSAAEIKAQAKALKDSRDAAHETAGSFFDLGKGLDNAKVSLNGWIHQMEKQAAALQHFRENAEAAAKKGLDEGLIAALEKAGPAGALRMKQLADATDHQIKRANGAWRDGQREINKYTDAVGGVPKPILTADDRQVREVLRNLRSELHKYGLTKAQATALLQDAASGKIKTVQGLINKYGLTKAQATALMQDLASSKIKSVLHLLDLADGKVSKSTIITEYKVVHSATDALPHKANGGFISGPGGPRDDKIPAFLSNGEFVVNAAATAANLPTLQRINAQRFAAGGMASYTYSRTNTPETQAANDAADALDGVADKAKKTQIAFEWVSGGMVAELKVRQKLLEQEVERDKKRRDMLRQERDAIMSGITSIIQGSADLLASTRVAVIPQVGSTDEITWTDAPATFQSFSTALQTQFGTASQLAHVLKVLKRKGFSDAALNYLLSQGAPIATLEDFASQTAGDLAGIESQFEALQQLTHGVGVQGVAAAGVESRLDRTNHHLVDVTHELKDIRKELQHLHATTKDAPAKTGSSVSKAVTAAQAARSRTASRLSQRS